MTDRAGGKGYVIGYPETENQREGIGNQAESGWEADVCIPAYRPGRRFGELMRRLSRQRYPVRKIIIINTEEALWDPELIRDIPQAEVHHISREEFDHGAARNLAAACSQSPVMIFMTDDAVPADRDLVGRLVEGLKTPGPAGEVTAMAYARQLPNADCAPIERLTRAYNYPDRPLCKTGRDLDRLGIKTYFASNVCCAYRREIFDRLGGFVSSTIFNEDMIYAAGVIREGFCIRYVPEARVLHSHNFTCLQQFHRNFDLAVSQADHPEVFAGVPSEGEGIRMVKQTAVTLAKQGQLLLIPLLICQSAAKYSGYLLGKRYRRLPKGLILLCSGSSWYWKKRWRTRP